MTTPEDRLVIPRCIGCGSMREFETCEHGCDERRIEVIAAGAVDELVRLESASRARIAAALPVLEQLAGRAPPVSHHAQAQAAAARSARQVLRDAGPAQRHLDDPPEDPERVELWRCAICGGVDAPQECIGVCIWRRFEWVEAGLFDERRARMSRLEDLERFIHALLVRVAYSHPRDGAWEQNWAALSTDARRALALAPAGPR